MPDFFSLLSSVTLYYQTLSLVHVFLNWRLYVRLPLLAGHISFQIKAGTLTTNDDSGDIHNRVIPISNHPKLDAEPPLVQLFQHPMRAYVKLVKIADAILG